MTSPTQTSNSGGLGSLRLTSSLAAAVLSGVGHPPLPGMFKWDAAKFEEEIKREKRIRRKQKVIGCLKRFVAFLFSHVGLAGMVVVYSIVGAFIFQVIEKEQEKADKIKYSRMKDVYINRTVDLIRSQIYYYNNRSKKISKHHVLSYNINMQNNLNSTRFVQYHNDQLITEIENLSYDMLFNIFLNFQENVTEAVKSGGWDGKDETTDDHLQWSFAGALLYVVTVITTIGYGHIAPKTQQGRILTILYALIGIPLTFLYLSNIGNFLADSLKKICCGVCCCLQCKRKKDREIMRLKRKQHLMNVRRELSMMTYTDLNGINSRPKYDTENNVLPAINAKNVTEISLLSPASDPYMEKKNSDKDLLSSKFPSSSISGSFDYRDVQNAAIGDDKNKLNNFKNNQNKSYSPNNIESTGVTKFKCSVTITPPEDETNNLVEQYTRVDENGNLKVVDEFKWKNVHNEKCTKIHPSNQEDFISLSNLKNSQNVSRKRMRIRNIAKYFEEMEETAILSDDDTASLVDECKEKPIFEVEYNDEKECEEINHGSNACNHSINKIKRNDSTDLKNMRNKKYERTVNGENSNPCNYKQKNVENIQKSTSLDLPENNVVVDCEFKDKVYTNRTNTCYNMNDEENYFHLKRVETAPITKDSLMKNFKGKNRNSDSKLVKKSSSMSDEKQKDMKDKLASNSICREKSIVGVETFFERTNGIFSKSRKKVKKQSSQKSEREEPKKLLKRTNTMPTSSTLAMNNLRRENSLRKKSREPTKGSKVKRHRSNLSAEEYLIKMRRAQLLVNSASYFCQSNSDNRLILNPSENKRYLNMPAVDPLIPSISHESMFNFKPFNQQQQNLLQQPMFNQNLLTLKRPSSVIGMKSLQDLRNHRDDQHALHNSNDKNETSKQNLSSAVSYIALQPSANQLTNPNGKLSNESSLQLENHSNVSPADIFIGDDPLMDLEKDDLDDDDLDELGQEHKVTVPIYVCLIIIAGYISGGAMLFQIWEEWDYVASSYFCFITLSTIGFGDIVPGTYMNSWDSHEKLVLCTLWLAFGLSLLAMCFNLMQEGVKEKCRLIGQKLGLLKSENGSM